MWLCSSSHQEVRSLSLTLEYGLACDLLRPTECGYRDGGPGLGKEALSWKPATVTWTRGASPLEDERSYGREPSRPSWSHPPPACSQLNPDMWQRSAKFRGADPHPELTTDVGVSLAVTRRPVQVTHKFMSNDNACCLKPLNFKVVCYIAIANCYDAICSKNSIPLRILRNLTLKVKIKNRGRPAA